jgi:hypothetical protein
MIRVRPGNGPGPVRRRRSESADLRSKTKLGGQRGSGPSCQWGWRAAGRVPRGPGAAQREAADSDSDDAPDSDFPFRVWLPAIIPRVRPGAPDSDAASRFPQSESKLELEALAQQSASASRGNPIAPAAAEIPLLRRVRRARAVVDSARRTRRAADTDSYSPMVRAGPSPFRAAARLAT